MSTPVLVLLVWLLANLLLPVTIVAAQWLHHALLWRTYKREVLSR